jgi:hypothetical protein
MEHGVILCFFPLTLRHPILNLQSKINNRQSPAPVGAPQPRLPGPMRYAYAHLIETTRNDGTCRLHRNAHPPRHLLSPEAATSGHRAPWSHEAPGHAPPCPRRGAFLPEGVCNLSVKSVPCCSSSRRRGGRVCTELVEVSVLLSVDEQPPNEDEQAGANSWFVFHFWKVLQDKSPYYTLHQGPSSLLTYFILSN